MPLNMSLLKTMTLILYFNFIIRSKLKRSKIDLVYLKKLITGNSLQKLPIECDT